MFTISEIMRWKDLSQQYEQELRNAAPGKAIFDAKSEEGNKRWKDLKVRVVEHVSTCLWHCWGKHNLCVRNASLCLLMTRIIL